MPNNGRLPTFRDWAGQDDPSYREARLVEAWIAQLGDRPWAEPSQPVPEMTNLARVLRQPHS